MHNKPDLLLMCFYLVQYIRAVLPLPGVFFQCCVVVLKSDGCGSGKLECPCVLVSRLTVLLVLGSLVWGELLLPTRALVYVALRFCRCCEFRELP